MKRPKLSVIILSFNTCQLLKNCLSAVYQSQKVDWDYEVIVVDNASTDESVAIVKKEFPGVRLIVSKENLGFSGGNNLGIKAAKGELILFLNSDTELYSQALKKAVDLMEKNPGVGALTVKTLLASGKIDPDCHRGFPTPWASITYFLGLEKLFPKSRLFGQYHKFFLDMEKNHEIDAGAGAFMMIRREIIEKVGVWDEAYFFYGEDLDYFYRIKKAGYKVLFCAEPLLVHYKGASSGLRKESKKISRNTKENRMRVARASVKAMEIFYHKFYKDKYPSWVTSLALMGIKIKGFFRILYHRLS